jgi:hypothetical protein
MGSLGWPVGERLGDPMGHPWVTVGSNRLTPFVCNKIFEKTRGRLGDREMV